MTSSPPLESHASVKLTLFSLPKPFDGVYARIQDNALKSWAALTPRPEIILFGNEPGTAEAARRHGCRHAPQVQTNAFGTPLVSDLFRSASALTHSPYQCFLNSDIILDPELPRIVDRVHAWRSKSLIVCRRWDLDTTEVLEPGTGSSWYAPWRLRACTQGELYTPLGMDLFVFPTGLFDRMPPFSIGWPGAKYDNWIVFSARRRGIPIVDATPALTTIHQNHPLGSGTDPRKAQEHWISLDLLGGYGCLYDIHDASHILGGDGRIRRQPWQRDRVMMTLRRFVQRSRYRLRRLGGFRYATWAGGAGTESTTRIATPAPTAAAVDQSTD